MKATLTILFWLCFLGGTTWFFYDLLEYRHNPNQAVQATVGSGEKLEVVLQRNYRGHYVADGKINGQIVTFFLDTGATNVSIPEKVANRLGLKRGVPIQASTANGIATMYATKIERLSLGHIESNQVTASINPHMGGEEILLGMTFLKHLEMVQLGDKLTLRLPPQ